MLAKKYRLPVQEFSYKRPQETQRSKYFLLKSFPNGGGASRLGVVISKAVAAKSTRRNKLKRIIFDFFKDYQTHLPTKDFLLIALPQVILLKNEALREEVKKILSARQP